MTLQSQDGGTYLLNHENCMLSRGKYTNRVSYIHTFQHLISYCLILHFLVNDRILLTIIGSCIGLFLRAEYPSLPPPPPQGRRHEFEGGGVNALEGRRPIQWKHSNMKKSEGCMTPPAPMIASPLPPPPQYASRRRQPHIQLLWMTSHFVVGFAYKFTKNSKRMNEWMNNLMNKLMNEFLGESCTNAQTQDINYEWGRKTIWIT